MKRAVLIVGHGSRDSAANAEHERVVSAYRALSGDHEVAHAYVELADPPLPVGLARLAACADEVVVVPLFLFAAGHVKNDVPLAVAQARRDFPAVRFTVAPQLGVHPLLVELAYERARIALDGARDLTKTALIVVGRGSSDPDANADFCKVVRLLAEGRSLGWVLPSFIGVTRPLFPDAAELIARARPERVVVVPYFLFAGRLMTQLAGQVAAFRTRYPWIKIELVSPLGGDARVLEVVKERVQHALHGARPLPCDTCQYRLPVAGVTHDVGGLKALLWSIRHGFTHTQAAPHVHAHRPLTKHVLVCGNADCADRGSIALIAALRRLLKANGRDLDIRVTRSACMGRCGEGPTVAVYPDGVWYRGVRTDDARELVSEHLLADRLVSRLVDNIMQ